tara:strand:- start:1101 stop:1667 length:567 start_codon:yes stop_codon:yes gene_type:complete
MKMVKELDWEGLQERVDEGQQVWAESLYFNPEIYDYAKDNNLDLRDLLVSLQMGSFGTPLLISLKGQISRDISFTNLLKEMFGSKIVENEGDVEVFYSGVGSGASDKRIFARLAKMDEKTIKSPLNVADLGLWDWKFGMGGDGWPRLDFYPDEAEGDKWVMAPFLFGLAKSFTHSSPLFNYHTLPKGG